MDTIIDEKRHVLIRKKDGKFYKINTNYKARNWVKDILDATFYKTKEGAKQPGIRIKLSIAGKPVDRFTYVQYIRKTSAEILDCKRTSEFDAEQFEVKNINVTIR